MITIEEVNKTLQEANLGNGFEIHFKDSWADNTVLRLDYGCEINEHGISTNPIHGVLILGVFADKVNVTCYCYSVPEKKIHKLVTLDNLITTIKEIAKVHCCEPWPG